PRPRPARGAACPAAPWRRRRRGARRTRAGGRRPRLAPPRASSSQALQRVRLDDVARPRTAVRRHREAAGLVQGARHRRGLGAAGGPPAEPGPEAVARGPLLRARPRHRPSSGTASTTSPALAPPGGATARQPASCRERDTAEDWPAHGVTLAPRSSTFRLARWKTVLASGRRSRVTLALRRAR